MSYSSKNLSRRTTVFCALFLFCSVPVARAFQFTTGGFEAKVAFEHKVLFKSKSSDPQGDAVLAIQAQLGFLKAALELGFHDAPRASPKSGHPLDVRVVHLEKDRYEALFRYEGVWVIAADPDSSFEFPLPATPQGLWERTLAPEDPSHPRTLCTLEKYSRNAEHFALNWDPTVKGCPMAEGKDYSLARVTLLEKHLSEKETFPEYQRLVDREGRIEILILVGMDYPLGFPNPLKSGDSFAPAYRSIRARLIEKLGFSARRLSKAEIDELYFRDGSRKPPGQHPFIEEFLFRGNRAEIRVRMAFSPSGKEDDSRPLHHLFRRGLENASVIFYGGHSGYGRYLDPSGIEKSEGFRIRMDLSRYQILVFDACSSSSYYLEPFFSRKRTPEDSLGSKNLDIISSGLSVPGAADTLTENALLTAIRSWAVGEKSTSYQEILGSASSVGSLFSVDGDENNPNP